MHAVVVIGPPGSGKTTVLTALHDLLVDDGVPHAVLEVEALAWSHPPLPDTASFRHLAALRRLYVEAGYELILCGATATSAAYLRALLEALAAEASLLVRLEARPASLRERIVAREPAGWPGLEALLRSTAEIAGTSASLEDIDLTFATEEHQAPVIAERIRDALRLRGLPGLAPAGP